MKEWVYTYKSGVQVVRYLPNDADPLQVAGGEFINKDEIVDLMENTHNIKNHGSWLDEHRKTLACEYVSNQKVEHAKRNDLQKEMETFPMLFFHSGKIFGRPTN
jgi:hypothetical protein